MPDSRSDPHGYRLHLDADERAFLALATPAAATWPASPPRWEVVADLARVHRLGARLHRATERIAPEPGPPAEIRTAWRTDYFAGLHESIALLDQRDRVVSLLVAAGIRPMVLKGAALSGSLYPDPAVRPMGDVDLLLPRGTTAQVAALSAAWARHGADARRLEIEEDHHDLTMDGAYAVDYRRLWSEALPAPFGDGAALVPSLEDQLLMVCVSCCRNSFWKLVTVLDAAEILHQHGGRIDWDRTVARARSMQLDIALDTLLALVDLLFDVHAPAPVRLALRPLPWRRRLVARFLAGYRLHAGAGLERVNIARPIGAFALKYAVNRPRVLARQARTLLVPEWKWMRAHYPDAGTGEILLRYAAHPFVVAGLALRLARDRARRPPA